MSQRSPLISPTRTLLAVAVALALLATALPAAAQVSPEQLQAFRDDAVGDPQFRKSGIMDGNQVRTLFYNQGEVGNWPSQPSGEWPKGTGHSYLDGVSVLVGAEFEPASGPRIQSVAAAYREWMDQDPVTGQLWGWSAVPGYVAPASETPALSNQPASWPETWPAALGLAPDWDGLWYGYFGRGVTNADLETFYVMDDSQDEEFAQPPYNYMPIAGNTERAGMGLRVEVRGFQWSQVLAEDNIFWHYDIVNISDRDYPRTAFGFYTDLGIGGTDDSADDQAFYDVDLDIAYGFDGNGIGTPNNWSPVGYMGYAYLESPGDPYNGLDDDGDGLVDERRDDGLDNDGDWVAYSDENGNGQWDEDEPLNNDVGRDGVGPLDPQYNGPDEGEADGLPTPGEPNFDATDIDESDQIGLQSLAIYRLIEGGTGPGWPRHDPGMWQKLTSRTFDTELQNANVSMVFGAGPFELRQGTRERFSMALVYGEDLEDLTANKETVQQIYNANYNFARPPNKATLTAVPGDGRVVLYWDAAAEDSRDPFLGNRQDFEGYLVYRSRDAEFNDIKTITDSRGRPFYWEPIAQFDLDNGIEGPDPVGVSGAHFWRGTDSGLQHSFVDTTVTNGVRYYYAVVAYDQGDPEFGTQGLPPSETTKIIREDFSGNVQFTDINTAVVTPNAPAAGYVPPQVEGDLSEPTEGEGSGSLAISVLDPALIAEGATYRIVFHSEEGEAPPQYYTSSYDIVRVEGGEQTVLHEGVDATQISAGEASPPFDGIIAQVRNDTTIVVDVDETGWLLSNSDTELLVGPFERQESVAAVWPADYVVTFHNEPVYTTPFFDIELPITIRNVTGGYDVDMEVLNEGGNGPGSLEEGAPITIVEYLRDENGEPIPNRFRLTWDITPNGPISGPDGPRPGDQFQIHTTRPFQEGDYFEFRTVAPRIDEGAAADGLDDIAVVPNPYTVSAGWERRTLNQSGRGERKIDFIHLPQRCTIRIYTVSGALVKTIVHDSAMDDGSASWNLVSDDGMDISYGVYIYHVDADGLGERVGKFAVIK